MKAYRTYERLYGENLNELSDDYLFSELIETRSPDFSWEIGLHMHPNLCQIFYVHTGSFSFYNEEESIEFNGPVLLFIPSKFIHGFKFENNVSGRIISLASTLTKRIIEVGGLPFSLFTKFQTSDACSDSLFNSELFSKLMETIDDELFKEYFYKDTLLHALLQQLFIYMSRLWQIEELDSSNKKAVSYFYDFERLIKESNFQWSIKQYANKLGISTVHLNRICNKIANQSASSLIQRIQLQQAKQYLLHTNYTISEIAYLINFEYPNYFARFFKKHTGLSPKDFRKQEIKKDKLN